MSDHMCFSLPYMYFRPDLLSLSNDKIIYPIQDPGSRKHKIQLYFLEIYTHVEVNNLLFSWLFHGSNIWLLLFFCFNFREIPWKISEHAVFPCWWIWTPCALAANTWLTKFITYRWAYRELVPRKLVVRTFPLQLSRKAWGSNHSNQQAVTLKEAPPIVTLIYWSKQWNKNLCLKCDLNRTVLNLCEIV